MTASPAAPTRLPDNEPHLVRGLQLHAAVQTDVPWLWRGYLARGDITLFTSQWRAGKTTLLSVLLSRLAGEGSLAGMETHKSRVVVVSEEAESLWARRSRRLGPWEHAGFFCRPYRGAPDAVQWARLIERLARLREAEAVDLAVIDTLATFLPRGAENVASKVLDAMRPLEQLTSEGVAVMLLHHPRKGEVLAGQAARGSGALCARADVLMEMHWVTRKGGDRRRLLCAWSRHEETPPERLIELTADGSDYRVLAEGDAEFEQSWQVLEGTLACAEKKLTRKAILRNWPGTRPPAESTLWRWLERAVQLRRVECEGKGVRGDPVRYWLPGRDLPWYPDFDDILDLDRLGAAWAEADLEAESTME